MIFVFRDLLFLCKLRRLTVALCVFTFIEMEKKVCRTKVEASLRSRDQHRQASALFSERLLKLYADFWL